MPVNMFAQRHAIRFGNAPCLHCEPFHFAIVHASSREHAARLVKEARDVRIRFYPAPRDQSIAAVTKKEALRILARPLYNDQAPAVRLHLDGMTAFFGA